VLQVVAKQTWEPGQICLSALGPPQEWEIWVSEYPVRICIASFGHTNIETTANWLVPNDCGYWYCLTVCVLCSIDVVCCNCQGDEARESTTVLAPQRARSQDLHGRPAIQD